MNERKANELSIFEKAERYDRAIERARNHHDRDGLTLEQYETIDIIFPELKESEDEKIRKGAISSIKRFIEYTEEEDCAPDIKDMLIKNAKKQIAWLEKQGEKSTGEEMKEALRTEYEKGRADAIAEMQKPAWSEEDKQYLLICKNALAKYQVSDKWDATIISRWLEDKLKSLKDRIGNFDDGYKVGFSAANVDLEAELNKWRHNHFHGRRDKDASGEYLERISQLELAKHFFELGIKAKDK